MANAPARYRPAHYQPPTYRETRLPIYGSQRWREYSLSYRRAHPLCVLCDRLGITRPSQCVDHIKPVTDENDRLFWEPTNHQGLCNRCHGQKTKRDGLAGKNRRRA